MYRPPRPFLEPASVPVALWAEARFAAIREEAASLSGPAFFGDWRPYLESDSYEGPGRWDVLSLYGGGRANERLLRRCPAIAELLRQVPHLRQALLSSLSPGTRIRPHRGAAGIVRVHLPLLVQAGRAGWRVAGEARLCEEGRVVVFEDGCLHEAWNDGDLPRITLAFDTLTPHLAPEEAAVLLRAYDESMAAGRAAATAEPGSG